MVTSAREWKGRIRTEGAELELPSENVALVRQISPQAFLTSGLIPDPLTAIIRQAINTKSGLPPKKINEIAEDPEKLSAALEMFDRVLTYVVMEPVISMPPACDTDVNGQPCDEYANADVHKTPTRSGHHQYHEGPRDPDVLYADTVDMDDKMFIFNWVLGGTRDLATFREELRTNVATVSDGKAVQGKAKRPARPR